MKSIWNFLVWRILYYGFVVILLIVLIETIRLNNTGFESKSLWDWMELLIIPVALSLGAFFLNNSARENDQKIAKNRQQGIIFQSYLDQMTELILKEKLLTAKNKDVRNIAKTRTLTVLRELDKERKGLVIKFLYDAKLVFTQKNIVELTGADLREANLSEADLSKIDFSGANLFGANLSNTKLNNANFSGANLMNASLFEADLIDANFSGANLLNTSFFRAELEGANIRRANSGNHYREAFFSNVKLNGTNFSSANLTNADLTDSVFHDADFRNAYLRNAKISAEQLANSKYLKDTIMPDGTKHD